MTLHTLQSWNVFLQPAASGGNRMTGPLFRVDGEVYQKVEMTCEDLKASPDGDQTKDVSRFHGKHKGEGVTLNPILERADSDQSSKYLTLHATRDQFQRAWPQAEQFFALKRQHDPEALFQNEFYRNCGRDQR